jgi:hypothetical protein
VRDLSKAKLSQFSKALDAAQAAFRTEVDALAEKARAEILPYFKKQGLGYVTGNGTWYISRIDTSHEIYDDDRAVAVCNDELPANIRAVLELEVARADYLGLYIRDIKRGEW